MTPEEQHVTAVWHLLQRIERATLHLPANHPVREGEEVKLYELDILSSDEINHLKRLHHEKAIDIQHPKLTGFVSPEKYPVVVNFVLGKNFKDIYHKYEASSIDSSNNDVTIRLNKVDTKMYLETSTKQYQIAKFRQGSDPNKLFDYLMNNEGHHVFRTAMLYADCPNYKYHPTDLARRLSKHNVIREYFIPTRSKQDIEFRKSVKISQRKLAELEKTLKI